MSTNLGLLFRRTIFNISYLNYKTYIFSLFLFLMIVNICLKHDTRS